MTSVRPRTLAQNQKAKCYRGFLADRLVGEGVMVCALRLTV